METFKKRQKEMKRLDRQKEKAARRIQRKLNPAGSADDPSSDDIPKTEPDSLPTSEPTTEM
jgi:hypothetical protein